MKIVPFYEADDGEIFDTEAQCLEYEEWCADVAAANEMLSSGETLLAALARANRGRSWWDSSLSAEDKETLGKITKNTGLIIIYLPSNEQALYRPYKINNIGQVGLRREDGKYHNFVGMLDVLEYARQTKASGCLKSD